MKSQNNFTQPTPDAAPNKVLSTKAATTLLEIELRYTNALIQAALAARLKWLQRGDRDWARQMYLATRSAAESKTIQSQAIEQWIEQLIVPIAIAGPLLHRIDKVCERFSEMFESQADGVKYADYEIDDACDALPDLIRHAVGRIVTLNGSAPDLLNGNKTT